MHSSNNASSPEYKQYRTKYQFSLSAKFTHYSNADDYTFVYDNGNLIDFYIRDYCAAMYLSDPPGIKKAQVYSQDLDYVDTFNVSRVESDESLTNYDGYSYKLQKSLMTLTNNVYLDYMYYMKWSPNGKPALPWTNNSTGCGTL